MTLRTYKIADGSTFRYVARVDTVECQAFDRRRALMDLENELRKMADHPRTVYSREP